ncbi:hypothetical protein [Niallia sp. RD1]|nr:hypothetical protein [Niallia sp. RD1]
MIKTFVEQDRWNGIYKTKITFLGLTIYERVDIDLAKGKPNVKEL